MEITRRLETTVHDFVEWVIEHTSQSLMERSFPTEKGRYVLEKAWVDRHGGLVQTIDVVIDGVFTLEGTGCTFYLSNLITLTPVPQSGGHIEVHAKCSTGAVVGYFKELLTEIDRHWLQDHKQVNSPAMVRKIRPLGAGA